MNTSTNAGGSAAAPVLCWACNKPILRGNKNKVFCDEKCKDNYHNQLKKLEHAELQQIKSALVTNRRILKKLLGMEVEIMVSKNQLVSEGFNFEFHTHHRKSKFKGNEY